MTLETWRNFATFINLVTFFFGFSAFSVGLYIQGRVKKGLKRPVLRGVVNGFLVAAGGLTLRTFLGAMAQLGWVNVVFAAMVGDLALLAMAGGVFFAYLSLERYFKELER